MTAKEETLDGTSEEAAWIDGLGWIDAEQLREIPFCREQHRGKTFGKWELVRDEDGCLTIKSPLGRVYPIPPTGPVPLLGGTPLGRDPNPTPPKRKKRTRKQQRADRTKKEREENRQPPPS